MTGYVLNYATMRFSDGVALEAKVKAALHILRQLDADDRRVKIALDLLADCVEICKEHNLGNKAIE